MKALTLEIITRSLGEVGSTVVYVLVAAVVIEVVLYLLLTRVFKSKYAIPAMLLTPATIGLLCLIVIPIGWEVWISFTKMCPALQRELIRPQLCCSVVSAL
jgi:arabinogalactan oligomer/maltooligosaccharide transport system permease protein